MVLQIILNKRFDIYLYDLTEEEINIIEGNG